MDEAKFYNALNLLYRGAYSKLAKAIERHGSWQTAWAEEENKNIDADKEWDRLLDLGISVTLKTDSTYPSFLKEAPLAPHGIYFFGSVDYSHPSIAIVGTRMATPQGKDLAKTFARKLGNAGFAVISGLAMGVDEAAHKGALEAKGKTLAVLGTSLDNIYPKQNKGLADDILKSGGAIISEYPLGQEYHPQNFLIRNRIISGLAQATLVIEAPEKSGALATARFALDQNREVFVLPGNATSPNYKGSNALIKAGAALVDSVEDIMNLLGVENNQVVAKSDGNEDPIIAVLKKNNGELSADKLAENLGSDIGSINKNLAMLVIKGIIKEVNGKYYLG